MTFLYFWVVLIQLFRIHRLISITFLLIGIMDNSIYFNEKLICPWIYSSFESSTAAPIVLHTKSINKLQASLGMTNLEKKSVVGNFLLSYVNSKNTFFLYKDSKLVCWYNSVNDREYFAMYPVISFFLVLHDEKVQLRMFYVTTGQSSDKGCLQPCGSNSASCLCD